MIEEPTIENISELIDMVTSADKALTPLERVIASYSGTVQTLLSLIAGTPVTVRVISQKEDPNTHIIHRWSKLIADYGLGKGQEVTMCLAYSLIPKELNTVGFVNGILEKQKGIGQLIHSIPLDTKRTIQGVYSDENIFARTYVIEGVNDCRCYVHITEVFPRSALPACEMSRRQPVRQASKILTSGC